MTKQVKNYEEQGVEVMGKIVDGLGHGLFYTVGVLASNIESVGKFVSDKKGKRNHKQDVAKIVKQLEDLNKVIETLGQEEAKQHGVIAKRDALKAKLVEMVK